MTASISSRLSVHDAGGAAPRAEISGLVAGGDRAARFVTKGIGRIALLLVAGLLPVGLSPACAQTVWELTPYRVRVAIAAPDTPELRNVPRQLAESVSLRLESLLGAAWRIEVTPADASETHAWTLPDGVRDPLSLPQSWLKAGYDKVMLVRVDSTVDGWRVFAREWDSATCRLGLEVALAIQQPARLRDTAIDAISGAFRPLARIDRVETGEGGQRAVLRIRAGGLPTRDPDLQWVWPGCVFCPIVRANDREGRLRRDADGNAFLPQPMPWTFLVAESVRSAEASCDVQSGLSAPLSGSRRGRMEHLALGITPHSRTTRLTVLDRREPHDPMPGYEVFLQQSGQKTTTFLGRTDRTGGIDIEPSADAIAIVLVRSGQQLLARLPLVAGFASQEIAYLPDDTQRMEAEAFVVALQEQLVDVVTQREVLLGQAESQLDAGRADAAKELLVKLEQLPDRETLHRRLATRQSQLRSSDPHVQRQIETLFRDTSKLLDSHLDPAPVTALSQAISKQAGRFSTP